MNTTCEVADGEKVECTWLTKEGSCILFGRDQNELYTKYYLHVLKNQFHMIFKFHIFSWHSTDFDMSYENPWFKLDHNTKKP
jgi:hypothetical protein